MTYALPTAPTFDLSRSLAFLRGFPPCLGDFVIGADHLGGAFAIDDRAVAWVVRAAHGGNGLDITTDDARVVPMVRDFLGTDDDLAAFYAKAARDVPAYRAIVEGLRGLHHVRFPTLAEVTVHAVLAQRTPIAMASRQKRAVAAALGPRTRLAGLGGRAGLDSRANSDGPELVAFPTLARVAALDAPAWQSIVGHAGKAARLPGVVRGVHALGETWLRTAPYAAADAALRAIPGIGPFSAAMILLRGLGRTEDVPLEVAGIADVARAVYGPGWDAAATRRHYGADVGTWSFYLKAGASRRSRVAVAACAP